MIGGNGTGGCVDRLGGGIEVLADVTCVNGDNLVRRHVVSPFHPVRDGGPDKRNSRPADKILAQGCSGKQGG